VIDGKVLPVSTEGTPSRVPQPVTASLIRRITWRCVDAAGRCDARWRRVDGNNPSGCHKTPHQVDHGVEPRTHGCGEEQDEEGEDLTLATVKSMSLTAVMAP